MTYVPIDEGEAEAQPDLPAVTIRLLHEGGQQADFPWTVRFEVPARGKRGVLDQFVHDAAVRWLQGAGLGFEGKAETGWLDVEGERVWAATYTVSGYA